MEKKIKVLIVDDHDMFRAGLKVLLEKSQKMEFMGEAQDGKKFLEILDTLHPDVVLMDISMPVLDGIEATRQAVQANPEIKILALSMFGEEEYYYKMIQAGVHGFVMKSAGINELEHAIQQVAQGSAYFSEELIDYVRQHIDNEPANEHIQDLSDKEIDILKSIAKGLTDTEISDSMDDTEDNIKNMRHALLVKCQSTNTTGLIMYAIKNKIVGL
jgi:DNA-binding NarL/FixJ family response regulator